MDNCRSMYIKIVRQEQQNLATIMNISQMLMMKATSLFSDHVLLPPKSSTKNTKEMVSYKNMQENSVNVACLLHI